MKPSIPFGYYFNGCCIIKTKKPFKKKEKVIKSRLCWSLTRMLKKFMVLTRAANKVSTTMTADSTPTHPYQCHKKRKRPL